MVTVAIYALLVKNVQKYMHKCAFKYGMSRPKHGFCTLWTHYINSRQVEALSACMSRLPCLCNVVFLAFGNHSLIIFCFLSPCVSGTNGSHVGRVTQAQNESANDLLLCHCWFFNRRPLCFPQSDEVLGWCEGHRRCAQVNMRAQTHTRAHAYEIINL